MLHNFTQFLETKTREPFIQISKRFIRCIDRTAFSQAHQLHMCCSHSGKVSEFQCPM